MYGSGRSAFHGLDERDTGLPEAAGVRRGLPGTHSTPETQGFTWGIQAQQTRTGNSSGKRTELAARVATVSRGSSGRIREKTDHVGVGARCQMALFRGAPLL